MFSLSNALTYFGFRIPVTADGQRAISASLDNTLKVWELESGEVLIHPKYQARHGLAQRKGNHTAAHADGCDLHFLQQRIRSTP